MEEYMKLFKTLAILAFVFSLIALAKSCSVDKTFSELKADKRQTLDEIYKESHR